MELSKLRGSGSSGAFGYKEGKAPPSEKSRSQHLHDCQGPRSFPPASAVLESLLLGWGQLVQPGVQVQPYPGEEEVLAPQE